MLTPVDGHVNPGFERVADAFRLNFTDRDDRGAACAVVIDGETVVDLWGGEARDGVPWDQATRGPVFSVSKAVTTVALLMAADEGLLDLDAPVSTYWPDFGQHGKGEISVRGALAHRAGVPAAGSPWTADELDDWSLVVADLAAQPPMWQPGTSFAYHAITVGFIAGEVLRRATGRRPSEWLAATAAAIDVQMSYGADVGDPGLAHMYPAREPVVSSFPPELEAVVQRVFLHDGAYGPDLLVAANTPGFLVPESPAANLVTTARDLASFFGATVHPRRGIRLLTDTVIEEALRPQSLGRPFVGPDAGQVWGTGFQLFSPSRSMVGPGSFGHDGAGGQLAFAHTGLRLGFAYQTNQPCGPPDVRAEALSVALRACV